MSRRRRVRKPRAEGERAQATRTDAGIDLPAANPPQKRPLQLVVAATLLAAWLAFLVYLAVG